MSASFVLTPSVVQFNACLGYACYNLYDKSHFSNVSWHYFANDPQSAVKLMHEDSSLNLLLSSSSTTGLSAIVVDGTEVWGGYPEDLAYHAQSLGYNILVIQQYGDEEYNCGFGAKFLGRNICPIPTFRVPATSQAFLKDALTVSLSNRGIWESTQAICKTLGALDMFSYLVLFVVTVGRLVALGAPKTFNLGVLLCYLSILLGIVLVISSVVDLNGCDPHLNVFNFTWNVSLTTLFVLISLYTTLLIAMKFHQVLIQVKALSTDSKMIWFIGGGVMIAIVTVLLVTSSVFLVAQVYSGMWTLAFVIFSFCRLSFGFYFVWGYVRLTTMMDRSSDSIASRDSFYMGKRLLTVSVCLVLSILCSVFTGVTIMGNFRSHSVIFFNLIKFFVCLGMVAEVNALPLKSKNVWKGIGEKLKRWSRSKRQVPT